MCCQRSKCPALCGKAPSRMPVRLFSLSSPLGPHGVDYFERFDVIGISDFERATMRAEGPHGVRSLSIVAPAGTEFVVPVIAGWDLGYSPRTVERNFGMAGCLLFPERWALPASPSEPADVELTFSAIVADTWSPQRRFGATIRSSLLFPRRTEGAFVPAPPEISPLDIVWQGGMFLKETGLREPPRAVRRTTSMRIPSVTSRVVSGMSGFVLGFGDYEGPIPTTSALR